MGLRNYTARCEGRERKKSIEIGKTVVVSHRNEGVGIASIFRMGTVWGFRAR